MQSSVAQKRRIFLIAFLVAMTIGNFFLALRLIPKLRSGYQDFTIFYTGARLIRDGQAGDLYNLAAQYRMQQTFTNVSIRSGPLPFNHPPFEALLFVPFTFLPYWTSYLLWTTLNVLMLITSIVLLRRFVPRFGMISPLVLGLLASAYYPIAIGLIQGQDIILFLLVLVSAMIFLGQDKDVLAGAILGLGLFRPQSIVPLVALLAIRRWRLLLGFVPVAVVFAGLAVAIMGWTGPMEYVRFVIHLEGTAARAFGPEAVPNLRGLIQELPGINATGPTAHVLILVSSLIVLSVTARRLLIGRDSIIFAFYLGVVTTILVSFHTLVYDFTMLFPIVLFLVVRMLNDNEKRIGAPTILIFFLFLTPLYVYLLLVADAFFLYSLILLWLFVRLLRTPAPAEVPA